MDGIESFDKLQEELLYRSGKIVGILFCSYRDGDDDTINNTWAKSFDDWDLFSAEHIDILAAGYVNLQNGNTPWMQDAVKVREVANNNWLWFSKKALYDCAERVMEKNDNKWNYSSELDILFVKVGIQHGIDWNKLLSVDVGMLVNRDVYGSADRFVNAMIGKFRKDKPTEIDQVYRSLIALPNIQKYSTDAAKGAVKMIPEVLKLFLSLHGGGHL
jgi:hypothetical protein